MADAPRMYDHCDPDPKERRAYAIAAEAARTIHAQALELHERESYAFQLIQHRLAEAMSWLHTRYIPTED